MKKRFFGICLAALVSTFVGCGLESDDENSAIASWLNDQGMPASYKVDVLDIPSVSVVSMKAERQDSPTTGYTLGAFGKTDEFTRDYYLDFAFNFTKGNKRFIAAFRRDTTTEMYLRLFPLTGFYKPVADSLPYEEEMNVEVSWVFEALKKKSQLDSVVKKVKDTTWYNSIREWDASLKYDSTYSWSFKGDTSAMYIALPDTFVKMLQDTSLFGGRLQMRISAPEAERTYRFYGHGSASYLPAIRIRTGISEAGKDSSYYLTPFRSAIIATGEAANETMLYGGTRDSLVMELDGDAIMNALSEFYGDDFPWDAGNGMDVRQAVVLAQFSFAKDDSKGNSELGLPIQAVASSYDDAYGDDEARVTESYKLNYEAIKETGHPNLVLYDKADSVTIQVTYGMRDFINRGSKIDNLKMMLRLGYPVLAPQDTVYGDYINSDGDTIYFFMDYFDYAKYDFAPALENGVNMKLWLVSNRAANRKEEE